MKFKKKVFDILMGEKYIIEENVACALFLDK